MTMCECESPFERLFEHTEYYQTMGATIHITLEKSRLWGLWSTVKEFEGELGEEFLLNEVVRSELMFYEEGRSCQPSNVDLSEGQPYSDAVELPDLEVYLTELGDPRFSSVKMKLGEEWEVGGVEVETHG